MGLDDDSQENSAKMPVVQVSSNIGACKPLDSIVELNYEASSDEELHVWEIFKYAWALFEH